MWIPPKKSPVLLGSLLFSQLLASAFKSFATPVDIEHHSKTLSNEGGLEMRFKEINPSLELGIAAHGGSSNFD